MYCGNNRRSPKLRSGQAVIGTRYGCLKKGIGVGLSLPYDPEYNNRFVPIDSRKIYCGDAVDLPEGYDILGTNSMCYSKGVGTGRKIKANKQRSGKWKVKNNKKKN